MSTDPPKISAIRKAGHSLTTEEVRSFLRACQFNAKFVFQPDEAYAQITKPLRYLLKKDSMGTACEEAHQQILNIMTSQTALRPIATVYQEELTGSLVLTDHPSKITIKFKRHH